MITVTPTNPAATSEALSRARDVLWDRLAFFFGSAAVRVSARGQSLRIELQDAADESLAIRIATTVEALSFVESADFLAPGFPVPPESLVILSDADIHLARLRKTGQGWNVELFLSPEGTQRLEEYTSENAGRDLLVAQAGVVLATSRIEALANEGYRIIASLESREQAVLLIALLRSGPLPCELSVVPEAGSGRSIQQPQHVLIRRETPSISLTPQALLKVWRQLKLQSPPGVLLASSQSF